MKQFRCDYCNHAPADTREDYLGEHVCLCCDGVCDSYFTCNVCKSNEAAIGADECISCICDQCEKDPREVDGLYGDLLKQVCKELAQRHKPYLRQKQAA